MKRLIRLSVLIIMSLPGYSQKQGNQWLFGIQAGLNFSTGFPIVQVGGQTGTDLPFGGHQEGAASICDSSGALLFYTGGKTIWNRFHQPMPNGTNIMGGPSSTQPALIVPKPSSDSLFYLFTSDEYQNNGSNGYRYTLVNMCLDNGKGDVVPTEKNVPLMGPSTEKLAACRDQVGTGYWVVSHKMSSNQFSAWHLTAGGITNTVTSLVGAMHGFNSSGAPYLGGAIGQMKINSQGNKIAVAVNNHNPPFVELGDFNSSTGVISNICHLTIDSGSANGSAVYGVEFSPNGSKLYASATGAAGTAIYQLDLQAGGGACQAILGSKVAITQGQPGLGLGLQLAPDNKIYSVFNSYYNLSCINAPDLPPPNCGFVSIAVAPLPYHYTLPSFIAGFNYSNNLVPCINYITKLEEMPGTNNRDISAYPNPVADKLILESPALTAQKHYVSIQNAFGQTVYNSCLLNPRQEIDMSCFEKGIYFLFIQGSTQRSAIKLMKD